MSSARHDGSVFRLAMRQGEHALLQSSEALLFAIGRVPNSDYIGIENTDLEPTASGHIESDESLRTVVDRVFCIGDVAGRHMFAHAASQEGEQLARNLVDGSADPVEYGSIPHAIRCEPEIARVGRTEQVLVEQGVPYVAAALPFPSATDVRSVTEQHGCCKILASPAGSILGLHIVGYQASMILDEALPFLRWRNNARALALLVHLNPSVSEILRTTAREVVSQLNNSQRFGFAGGNQPCIRTSQQKS